MVCSLTPNLKVGGAISDEKYSSPHLSSYYLKLEDTNKNQLKIKLTALL
jgi:hypothetical protein